MADPKQQSTIPIFFTFDRYYVLAAGVAIYSLLEHASTRYHYELYVVHAGLKERHMRCLRRIVNRFPHARISFVTAPDYDTAWQKLEKKSHFSKEIFYKMTAANLFPGYDRILFSDVDVIFTTDISSSFFLFPDEKFYFAGTRPILENPNLPGYRSTFSEEEMRLINDYEVSAGYMLINLAQMRADDMEHTLVDFFQRNAWRLRLPEQDCIALCCQPHIKFMDYKYGVGNNLYRVDPDTATYNTNNPVLADRTKAADIYRTMLRDAVQLHYLGINKPWNDCRVPRFADWLAVCRRAGLCGYWLSRQPLFLWQRIQRKSLRRFLRKLKARFFPAAKKG